MALSTNIKARLDTHFGPGKAAQIVLCINSQTTTADLGKRGEYLLGGIGEEKAFKTACASSGTLSIAAMNRLERILGGRGEAEAFALVVAAGTGA